MKILCDTFHKDIKAQLRYVRKWGKWRKSHIFIFFKGARLELDIRQARRIYRLLGERV